MTATEYLARLMDHLLAVTGLANQGGDIAAVTKGDRYYRGAVSRDAENLLRIVRSHGFAAEIVDCGLERGLRIWKPRA